MRKGISAHCQNTASRECWVTGKAQRLQVPASRASGRVLREAVMSATEGPPHCACGLAHGDSRRQRTCAQGERRTLASGAWWPRAAAPRATNGV